MPDNNTELVTGRIIKLSPRGYGFIISQDIPFTRFFFHWTELHQSTKKFTELEEGMKVEFIPLNINERGWRALRIRVIESNHEK